MWLISKLPHRLFYAFSDAVFVLVYHVVGYRKRVVMANLKLAFPDASTTELKGIRRKFYHHFCDIFLEMAKSISISEAELKARFVLKNPEEMQRLERLGKSYVIMLGHYNSYEWVTSLKQQGMQFKAYGIYKKLANRYFDDMICNARGKFDTHMLSKDDVVKEMVRNKVGKVLSSYGMIADQSPRLGGAKYWRPFLGPVVPVFIGSETMAKKLDMAVTYLKIEKVKRGYYEAEFVTITDDPKPFKDYEITDRYIEMLSDQIRQKPENYLWTHKRWKHAGKRSAGIHLHENTAK